MMYFDHNATTPLHPEALEAMQPYLTGQFGNPSSVHAMGRKARRAVDQARETIAALLTADPQEIVFTSGATEANNIALQGFLRGNADASPDLSTSPDGNAWHRWGALTSAIEHPSVLAPLRLLEKAGHGLGIVRVDEEGFACMADLERLRGEDTRLLSIQYANNEVGTIQDIASICAWGKERDLFVHVDAAQAVGKIPVNFSKVQADAMSFSSQKFYGPKGVGAMVLRRGLRLPAFLAGGKHERGLRPGTENVAGIVGMAKALELACRDMAQESARLRGLKERLLSHEIAWSRQGGTRNDADPVRARSSVIARRPKADEAISPVNLGPADQAHQLPNTLALGFPGLDAAAIVMNLDMEGICVSSGAACTSGSVKYSATVLAMTGSEELARGGLRISMGRSNTEQDVDRLAEALLSTVDRMASCHPGPKNCHPERSEGSLVEDSSASPQNDKARIL